jgi:hypothetical protein
MAVFFPALKNISEISCLRGFVAAVCEALAAEPSDPDAGGKGLLLPIPKLARRACQR